MITADSLARELGCTLADLEESSSSRVAFAPDSLLAEATANEYRRRWSNLTRVDYTETVK